MIDTDVLRQSLNIKCWTGGFTAPLAAAITTLCLAAPRPVPEVAGASDDALSGQFALSCQPQRQRLGTTLCLDLSFNYLLLIS